MDRVIAGSTEAVEAEYGYGHDCSSPFILVHLWNNEPVTVEGFNSENALRSMVKSDYAECEKEFFFN